MHCERHEQVLAIRKWLLRILKEYVAQQRKLKNDSISVQVSHLVKEAVLSATELEHRRQVRAPFAVLLDPHFGFTKFCRCLQQM